jgi:hypothetical protein
MKRRRNYNQGRFSTCDHITSVFYRKGSLEHVENVFLIKKKERNPSGVRF